MLTYFDSWEVLAASKVLHDAAQPVVPAVAALHAHPHCCCGLHTELQITGAAIDTQVNSACGTSGAVEERATTWLRIYEPRALREWAGLGKLCVSGSCLPPVSPAWEKTW